MCTFTHLHSSNCEHVNDALQEEGHLITTVALLYYTNSYTLVNGIWSSRNTTKWRVWNYSFSATVCTTIEVILLGHMLFRFPTGNSRLDWASSFWTNATVTSLNLESIVNLQSSVMMGVPLIKVVRYWSTCSLVTRRIPLSSKWTWPY